MIKIFEKSIFIELKFLNIICTKLKFYVIFGSRKVYKLLKACPSVCLKFLTPSQKSLANVRPEGTWLLHSPPPWLFQRQEKVLSMIGTMGFCWPQWDFSVFVP